MIVELTVGHTALSVGEDTLLLGSSDSDVEESALLLDVLLLTVSVARDQLILEPYAVDLLVLQSLGGMHSHQGDTGRAVLLLIRIGEERHIADKVLNGHRIVRELVVSVLILLHCRDQLIEVIQLRQRLYTLVTVHTCQLRGEDEMAHILRQSHAGISRLS